MKTILFAYRIRKRRAGGGRGEEMELIREVDGYKLQVQKRNHRTLTSLTVEGLRWSQRHGGLKPDFSGLRPKRLLFKVHSTVRILIQRDK